MENKVMSPPLIAERVLHPEHDPSKTIRVKLFAPENLFPDGDLPEQVYGWRCAYELEGLAAIVPGTRAARVVEGLDGLDALLMALVAIRGTLEECFSQSGIQFTWSPVAAAEGGHAIPYQVTAHLGPGHERELIDLMMKEDAAFIAHEHEFMARLRRARGSVPDEE
jgi:hypothetical protein